MNFFDNVPSITHRENMIRYNIEITNKTREEIIKKIDSDNYTTLAEDLTRLYDLEETTKFYKTLLRKNKINYVKGHFNGMDDKHAELFVDLLI